MTFRPLPEPDWRLFRQLREVALERFCERVLRELREMTANTPESSHQRYLEVFKLIDRRDGELGRAFDNPRRSSALLQLAFIRSHGLLTDAELARFSPETQQSIALLAPLENATQPSSRANRD
jgi:hypothetical protein